MGFEMVNDINLLSPKIGERIMCDEWGTGHFSEYTLTYVSKRTFRARRKIGSADATIRIRFCGKRDMFWRGFSTQVLNYQYVGKEVRE